MMLVRYTVLMNEDVVTSMSLNNRVSESHLVRRSFGYFDDDQRIIKEIDAVLENVIDS